MPKLLVSRKFYFRWVILIFLMPSVFLTMLLFLTDPRQISDFPYYLPESDVTVAKWLGQNNARSDITLAYYPVENYLPQDMMERYFWVNLISLPISTGS